MRGNIAGFHDGSMAKSSAGATLARPEATGARAMDRTGRESLSQRTESRASPDCGEARGARFWHPHGARRRG